MSVDFSLLSFIFPFLPSVSMSMYSLLVSSGSRQSGLTALCSIVSRSPSRPCTCPVKPCCTLVLVMALVARRGSGTHPVEGQHCPLRHLPHLRLPFGLKARECRPFQQSQGFRAIGIQGVQVFLLRISIPNFSVPLFLSGAWLGIWEFPRPGRQLSLKFCCIYNCVLGPDSAFSVVQPQEMRVSLNVSEDGLCLSQLL